MLELIKYKKNGKRLKLTIIISTLKISSLNRIFYSIYNIKDLFLNKINKK